MAVISVNSLENNVGVSSIALTLAEKINFLSKQSVCVIECDHTNPSFVYTLERTNQSLNSISTIMGYILNSEVTEEVKTLVLNNSKKFKNAEISVIYGSKNKKYYSDDKLKVLIDATKELYDVVILDYGKLIMSDLVLDKTDLHLYVADTNYRFLRETQRNKIDYFNNKTSIVINKYDKGISYLKYAYDDISNRNVIGILPVSREFHCCLANGAINIEKGNYYKAIISLSKKVMKKLDIPVIEKQSFVHKITKKDIGREEVVVMNEQKSVMLGDILVQEGICTDEDIKRALDIQKKLIKELVD